MSFVEWLFFAVGIWFAGGVTVAALVVGLQELSLRIGRRAAR